MIKPIILGIIQGLTEFLPVSSSGHLVLFESLLHYNFPGISFEIVLHLATLFAVLFYFNKKLLIFVRTDIPVQRHPLFLLILACIPAGLVGVGLHSRIENLFDNNVYLPFAFIVNGIFLYSLKWTKDKGKTISVIDAIIIGIFQVFAIIPGISRSGSTIGGAFERGVKGEEAFDFSFFLLIPAVLGAMLLDMRKIESSIFKLPYILGFAAAFITGIFALKLLKLLVLKRKLEHFGVYTFVVGVGLLIYYLTVGRFGFKIF